MFASNPLTYTAMKFPAPVCDDCAIPMVTLTAVSQHKTGQPPKVTYYQCQNCGCTLGATPGARRWAPAPAA
jgi:hypothetical protein